jgi:pSer/pThr/pTyr-binding forkhead associated (FHA) protein
MWDTASRMLGRVSVVAGAVTTTGMFDQKSEIVLDDQVVSVENALTIKTSELGSLRYGDSITVDGGSYRVRSEPFRMADGLLSVVSLERVVAVSGPVFEPGVFVSGVFA